MPSPPLRVPARVTVFGHDPGGVEMEVVARSPRWRTLRALRPALISLALAPVLVLVPPHVPWVIGALLGGAVLASRRWREHYTLLGIQGTCPRCGADLTLSRPTRLRSPLSVHCERCHHANVVSVAAEALPPP